ncbi:MAG: AlpA family phage regulatory protein [Cyanobacteria bacterium P01_E01_bin.6]
MPKETGFLRIKEVLAIIPVGRSTWWAGVKDGRFPQPIKLGPRTTVWRVEDIHSFIQNPTQISTKHQHHQDWRADS